ncbi:hypothetical protein SAMN05421763_103277 [[Luteovulum] sphaeroides subsp. megalophilum]|uniref:hypothetical protein n=1 Tax=Cereibacter sphaeroides TaxID=1063 RepID=UPI000B6408CD|nr:hypothetical protein [Cereibacter sphaeroides]SNS86777.1 hypothetical protein SAMN05421763_103277 [[Luteovulum] sphaeroides subsp. megalophilum]
MTSTSKTRNAASRPRSETPAAAERDEVPTQAAGTSAVATAGEAALPASPAADPTDGTDDDPHLAPSSQDEAPRTGQPASLVGQAEAGGEVSPPPADEPEPGPTLIVKGPARGRWRIGRHFTAEPVTIRLDELSDDEALRLAADPELTIVPVNAPY